jgi:hypothetical protein
VLVEVDRFRPDLVAVAHGASMSARSIFTGQ